MLQTSKFKIFSELKIIKTLNHSFSYSFSSINKKKRKTGVRPFIIDAPGESVALESKTGLKPGRPTRSSSQVAVLEAARV